MLNRAPIITVLGHVNHGKTTLLDLILNTHVARGEHGGITQQIRAFNLPSKNNSTAMTFIDTPGHAAFSNLRMRGAHLTDLVLLIVAMDDGPLNTTKEAMKLVRDFKLPCILTLTKLDKFPGETSRPKKVLEEIANIDEHFTGEQLGGSMQSVEISGTTGQNIPKLLAAIEAESEMLNLRYNPEASFEGAIMEVRDDEKLGGMVSAVIGKQGTLRVGEWLAAEGSYARVRSIQLGNKQHTSELGPSIPALISGWRQPAVVGSSIQVVNSLEEAEELAKTFSKEWEIDESFLRQRLKQEAEIRKKRAFDMKLAISPTRSTYEYANLENGSKLKVILKTDTAGSFEAISRELEKLSLKLLQTEHPFSPIVSESEGNLLKSLVNAVCFIFSPISASKRQSSKIQEAKKIYHFQSIYDLVEKAKRLVEGERLVAGKMSIVKIFKEHTGKGILLGARVTEGTIKASDKLFLGNDIQRPIVILSMRHGKEQVDSLNRGAEFGILIDSSEISIKAGDILVQSIASPGK